MQSGYGGEMQQFLVDGCPSALFSIPLPVPSPGNTPPDVHSAAINHIQLNQHQHPPPPPMPQFPHFLPMPITQQLFQQTHHQFQLFHHPQPHPQHQEQHRRMIPHLQLQHQHQHQHQHHHQHLGLDQDSGPENSSSPTRLIAAGGGGGHPAPSFLAAAMNFKLAVNDSSGGCSREGMNDEEGILHGDDGSESRFHPWQREEEATIKEPFWRPLDIDYINCRDNKKDKEPETSTNTYSKKSKDGNYKLFSELEAICKPGGSAGGPNNQTRSGSGLTGDENPLVTGGTAPEVAFEQQVAAEADHESDTSTEVPPSKLPKTGGGRRKRKRRQQQQQLNSIAAFFESLVKQLMEHQESLHRKFLEVMERRDQERTIREEAWRKQEAAKWSREAAARAEERALAASREAAIVAFLEKITGESLNLPTKPQFQSHMLNHTDHIEDTNADNNLIDPMDSSDAFNNIRNNINAGHNDGSRALLQLNTSRWPRAEVQALIRVRGSLEPRFQEPGLKGPLWEEVSTTMASIGYHRSAKRCKEKWENINKYFRKTKDSGKKRPQHSKTCPYFHQLDQLYSSKLALPPSSSKPNADRRDNSELLDAIVVSTEPASAFNFPELEPQMINSGGNPYASNTMAVKANADEDVDGDEEDGGDEEEGEGEEGEGEGESQVQWQDPPHFPNLHT